MSNTKNKSKFDKYIKVFSESENDYRIRLFLHLYEEIAWYRERNFINNNSYTPANVLYNITDFGGHKWKQMINSYFDNKITNLPDDVVHPEWYQLFSYITAEYLKFSLNITNVNTLNNWAASIRDLIKTNFVNAQPLSTEEFMLCLFDHFFQISFDNGATYVGMYANRANLANITPNLGIATNSIARFFDIDNLNPPPNQELIISMNLLLKALTIVDGDSRGLFLMMAANPGNHVNNVNDLDQRITQIKTYFKNRLLERQYYYTLEQILDNLKNYYGLIPDFTSPNINTDENWAKFVIVSSSDIFKNNKVFSYKLDKLIKELLLDSQDETQAVVKPDPLAFLDNESKLDKNQVYFRKPDGTLYVKENGKDVPINKKSDKFNELFKVETKCFTTGLNGDTSVCANYLIDCLEGNNDSIENCRVFLEDPWYWEKAADEVEKMLPYVAVLTLDKFKFRREEYKNEELNMTLTKFKDINDWYSLLDEEVANKKLYKDHADKIKNNLKLKHYLDLLVDKINSQPAILNEKYMGPNKVNYKQDDPNSLLSKYGIKSYYQDETFLNIDRLEDLMTRQNNKIAVKFGIPGMFGNYQVYNLTGGRINNTDDIINIYNSKLKDDNKLSGNILSKTYAGLKSILNKYNKTIDKENDEKIIELFDNYNKIETKLARLITTTDKYAQLLEIYGDVDGNSVLTFENLNELVQNRNKVFTKVVKRENNLFSILRTLVDAINKGTNNNMTLKSETKSNTGKINYTNL
jgi:hypothetical protein